MAEPYKFLETLLQLCGAFDSLRALDCCGLIALVSTKPTYWRRTVKFGSWAGFTRAQPPLIWLGEAEEVEVEQVALGLYTVLELRKSGRLDELQQSRFIPRPPEEIYDRVKSLMVACNISVGESTGLGALMQLNANPLVQTSLDLSRKLSRHRSTLVLWKYRKLWTTNYILYILPSRLWESYTLLLLGSFSLLLLGGASGNTTLRFQKV